jgi:hypothetical protein
VIRPANDTATVKRNNGRENFSSTLGWDTAGSDMP